MTDEPQPPPDLAAKSTNDVVRRLAWRYLFVLAAVVALMLVNQAIVQPMLIRVNAFAPAINVAGRQRMLSQKLTKASLALRDATTGTARQLRHDELRQALGQWTSEHSALRGGSNELGIQPINTADLELEWERLDPHYRAMVAAAQEITLPHTADGADSAASIATLVEHERQYLPTMDRIVKLMEDEAARSVFRLRTFALAITAAVVALIVGLGWFVVRPASRTIRSQVDELEMRVAQRTKQLSAALESLQHEIRERESAETKSQCLSAQLAHASRVTTMGHLTAGLAHELNQPLAAIANYTEACDVLLEGAPRTGMLDRVHNYIAQAKQAALRAGQIVRRMRNFVRPNAASTSPLDVNALVREIVELCRAEATRVGALLRLDLQATGETMSVDAIQIQQVLINLVQNSLQAMCDGDCETRQITIRTSTIGQDVQVDVVDTGPGFATANEDRVFEPFHTTKQDGLGIGLSICRAIVENHGGRIWCESRLGRGAQVSFTLPLLADDAGRFRTEPDRICC